MKALFIGAVMLILVACAPPEPYDPEVNVSFQDGTWSYEVSVEKPTPCHTIETNVTELPQQRVIGLTVVDPVQEVCPPVLTRETVTGEVDAPENQGLTILLNGEQIYHTPRATFP